MKLYNTIITVINKVFTKEHRTEVKRPEPIISLVDEVKPLEQNVKTFDFDFTPMIKAAMAKNNG